MKYGLVAVLLLVVGLLGAEPMLHPVSSVPGFWISEADMRVTVEVMAERDVYKLAYEKALLAEQKQKFTTNLLTKVVIVETAMVLVGILVVTVFR